MKKNYFLITLALTLIVNATSIKAVDFLDKKNDIGNIIHIPEHTHPL